MQVHPHALLFRGLAVRMAMSSGLVQSTSINPNNNRTELEGDLVRVLHALQDAPSGGQLIMDGATFAGEALPCLRSRMTACRQQPRGFRCSGNASAHSRLHSWAAPAGVDATSRQQGHCTLPWQL